MPPRLFALLAAVLACAGPARAAAPRPVTVQELCLLLHGGYTGDETLRETAGRPLLEPLDAAAEQTLRAAGADARFLATLRASRPALSEAEAEAARQQQAAAAARDAQGRAAAQSRLQAASPPAPTPPPAPTAAAAPDATGSNHLAGAFAGKLVALHNGGLQPCSDSGMTGKKLFAFYFSAGWCGPCRKFTPKLVAFYQDFAPRHPEFELVFVSKDHSAFDMENYMRQDAMPWPALAFDRREQEKNVMALQHEGIPDLVLVDDAGHILSDSYSGKRYLGPQHVLDDLVKLVAKGQ